MNPKSIPTAIVAAMLLALAPVYAGGGPGRSFAQLVASIRPAAQDDRVKLIRDAIAADSSIAPRLIASLVSHLPSDSPSLTGAVINAILGLNVSKEVKGALLTATAERAVGAALRIPRTAVPDLILTINEIKVAVGGVPHDLLPFVADYITPISNLPGENRIEVIASINTLSTQTIVSDDKP
jgi:hypothetical protein